jgi:glutamate synthase (NADPH/NADH) large chain
VRNSGAVAVVEGTGQHLCEYMTRGEVVVLGDTGVNIGAGMTGGVIYISYGNGRLHDRINKAYVAIADLDDSDKLRIRELIDAYYRFTGSPLAGQILSGFDTIVKMFRKVAPV